VVEGFQWYNREYYKGELVFWTSSRNKEKQNRRDYPSLGKDSRYLWYWDDHLGYITVEWTSRYWNLGIDPW